MDDGLLGMTKGVKDQSNVVVNSRNPIVQGDGLPHQLDCLVAAADLMGDDAE
jgi:hypothetical protein